MKFENSYSLTLLRCRHLKFISDKREHCRNSIVLQLILTNVSILDTNYYSWNTGVTKLNMSKSMVKTWFKYRR